MSGPLEGIRVIEIGHMLAGPYCGLLLADLGADVIKIESSIGDLGRHISPHSVGPYNNYFASLNRNKRSVVLDLASPQGQARLHELVRSAQALITNLRPSAIQKLGLTYDALKAINSRVVCVAITGFGLNSPFADRPAYDYIIQAMTGVMEMTGEPDGLPTKTGYSAVDNSTAIMAAFGLLARIIEGKGGQVDVALYDVMLSQLNYLACDVLNSGENVRRLGSSAHPYIVPAQVFATAQGELVLFISHDEFWRVFCREIGQEVWLSDERFATMSARRRNRQAVVAAVAEVLSKRRADEWVQRLVPLGVVAARVETLNDALLSEQVRARSMVISIETPAGPILAVGNPLKFAATEDQYQPPPLLGEHNHLAEPTIAK